MVFSFPSLSPSLPRGSLSPSLPRGSHRRFFCPPPTLYLSGKGWEDKRRKLEGKKSEGKGQVHRPCAFIGIGNSEQEMQQLSLEDKAGRRGIEGRREGGREGGRDQGREWEGRGGVSE